MKIINIDNYDRQIISDQVICQNVSEHWGKKIVELLNNSVPKHGEDYFKLVPDDYVLHTYNPE